MEKKYYLAVLHSPWEFGIPNPEEWPMDKLRELCGGVYAYNDYADALHAFATKPCAESEIFDNEPEANEWVDNAFSKMAEMIYETE